MLPALVADASAGGRQRVTALLTVRGLTKDFESSGGLFRPARVLRAVDDVSFEINEGETFGLVGESGSGKSTTGRCILRLLEPTAGEVIFRGRNLLALTAEEMRVERRNLQIVFQDPFSSLNPRLKVRQIVEEPLVIHRIGDRPSRRARVEELFSLVGLDPSHLDRYPHQFSGGQRQRIGLARALALNPSLVIADEPVSALDVSVQAQVVNLLMDLQTRLKLTYLFIAHDLRLVRQICDRVAVIYRGRIVELAAAERLFSDPRHDYTRALLSAIPMPDPARRPSRIPFDGALFDRALPLREVEPGHWAAVK
jgi:ABC-type oligopeptide transport system ATPase subunit